MLYIKLAIMAIICMISGYISDKGFVFGWMQGFSIIIGLILLVASSFFNEYYQDSQFRLLDEWVKGEKISVTRGKRGTTQTIRIEELVVGDVI